MKTVDLQARDLLLTPPSTADLHEIARACQDPDIAAWVAVPQPYAHSDAEFFLEHVVRPGWRDGTQASWTVRRSTDDPLVAMVGLHDIGARSGELGFWTAPWARREGVMSAAVQAVLDHAFDADGLGLERVLWQAYVGNWPSRRVAWRAGFRLEGTIRLEAVHRGVRRDSWVGTILAGDPREPNEPWPREAPVPA